MYKLILPVGDVKDDHTIYKPTGDVSYRVKRELKIQIYGNGSKLIHAEIGTVFLCSATGNITAIPDYIDVALWFDDIKELHKYVEANYEDTIMGSSQ